MFDLLLVGGLDSSNLLLLLGHALGKEGIVLDFLLLLYFDASALQCTEVTAALEADGGHKALDFRTRELYPPSAKHAHTKK